MSTEIVMVQPEEREILRNIYQFYLHDLSEFSNFLKISESGFFPNYVSDSWWERKDRHPYFIMEN